MTELSRNISASCATISVVIGLFLVMLLLTGMGVIIISSLFG
jgi:hypothetical protein